MSKLISLDSPSTSPVDSIGNRQSFTVKLWTKIITRNSNDIQDSEAYKKLCSETIPGWKGIYTSKTQVKDTASSSLEKTFKISCRSASPTAVVLCGRQINDEHQLIEAMMEDSQKSLWETGADGQRPTHAEYWYIEPSVPDARPLKLAKCPTTVI